MHGLLGFTLADRDRWLPYLVIVSNIPEFDSTDSAYVRPG
jgi:hypothetical protein